jgi:hypothetical protein
MSAKRASSVAYVPVAAVGLAAVAMLGLAVRIALFPKNHTQGTVSVLWGLGFAVYLWFGAWALGLPGVHAMLFALVAGAAIGLLIYVRGAGLESPPAARPGRFYRRLLARYGSARGPFVPYQPHSSTKTRELVEARVALELGAFETALFDLRDAFRVAVAQRKLDELVEVRELVRALYARSRGRTKRASDRLARNVDAGLQTFPADALASVGIHAVPERAQPPLSLGGQDLRATPRERVYGKTRELASARTALDNGEFAEALVDLRDARRVAVAQRKLDELLEVKELVEILCRRSSGRTRTASDRLASKVDAGLRSFAQAEEG